MLNTERNAGVAASDMSADAPKLGKANGEAESSTTRKDQIRNGIEIGEAHSTSNSASSQSSCEDISDVNSATTDKPRRSIPKDKEKKGGRNRSISRKKKKKGNTGISSETSEGTVTASSSNNEPEKEDEEYDSQVKKSMEVVEKSPKERYVRFNRLLGEGALKKVYQAWDTVKGIEVAWNKVKIGRGSVQSDATRRVLSEMKILQQLNHANIIHFFASWLDKETYTVNFITEIITSGSLKDFIQTRPVCLRILKRWCRFILEAMEYMHSFDQPIIHRDLKCENIFINGSTGDIRIGDMGVASWERRDEAQSVLGTPEYMAPELYEEKYDEQVDIYSFGMCVLEMVTKEVPYAECSSAPQIYRKVTTGVLPKSYETVKDCKLKEFIFWCIGKPKEGEKRPSAHELLHCAFLSEDDDVADESSLVDVSIYLKTKEELETENTSEKCAGKEKAPKQQQRKPDAARPPLARVAKKIPSVSDLNRMMVNNEEANGDLRRQTTDTIEALHNKSLKAPPKLPVTTAPMYICRVLSSTPGSPNISLQLITPLKTSINFSFQGGDTSTAVAMEMVREGVLPATDYNTVEKILSETIRQSRNAANGLRENGIIDSKQRARSSDEMNRERRQAVTNALQVELGKVEETLLHQAKNLHNPSQNRKNSNSRPVSLSLGSKQDIGYSEGNMKNIRQLEEKLLGEFQLFSSNTTNAHSSSL